MSKLFGPCLAAFRFLTVVPLPGRVGTSEEDLRESTIFFPLVGIVIGLVTAGSALVLASLLPPVVTAVVLVSILLGFSGALHLDGLADTADGFFSSRPRERILEIMRDSRIGAMGVVALLLVILLKISCLATLPSERLAPVVLLMPVAGRCAILLMMAFLPYARPAGGLAGLFYSRDSKRAALLGLGLLTGCTVGLGQLAGLVALGVVLVLTLLFSGYCHSKIGGATGDTLGAACELAETGLALGFSLNLWR